MKMAISTFCVAISVLILSGCQIDSADGGKAPPELVIVSEQISDSQRYDIDLTREDAIYLVAPALDASRMTVICPSQSIVSFSEYILTRIRPTGVGYDPTRHILRVANAAIVSFEGTNQLGKDGPINAGETCIVDCWDAGVKEQCNICDTASL